MNEFAGPDPAMMWAPPAEEAAMPPPVAPALAAPGVPLAALSGIKVELKVVLGRARMKVGELLSLNRGDVVELDRKAVEPVDVLVNDRLVARGEVVLVEGRIGVRLTEIVSGS